MTVFTWGEPMEPVIYNSAYFDEISLTVVPGPCQKLYFPLVSRED